MKTKPSTDYHPPMHAGCYYHVFNRTNNKELLFCDDHDRKAFLQKIPRFLTPYVDIFTYCLLGNHFHLQVRVKSIEVITPLIESIPERNRKVAQKEFLDMIPEERNTVKLMESQFIRFFTSYSMYFNKRHCRDGNLFYRRFKRVEIESLGHLQSVVYYIHANPVKHKTRREFTNYEWSSFLLLLSNERTFLARDEVFKWFGGKDFFMEYHYPERRSDGEDRLFLE